MSSAVDDVGPVVARVQALVAELAGVDPVGLPAGQALAETAVLLGVQQQVRVLLLARLADAQTRELTARVGFRSVRSWVRSVQPDADPADVSLARRLPGLPVLAAAVRQGRVSLRAARQVSTELGRVGPFLDLPDGLLDGQPAGPVVAAVVDNTLDLVARAHAGLAPDAPLLDRLQAQVAAVHAAGGSQVARVEAAFTLLAEQLAPRWLAGALQEQTCALLPTVLEDRDARAAERAHLLLDRTPDGSWALRGSLSPECGERLFTALGAEARRDPANPDDTGAWAAGQRARSRGRRLHDALHRLLERYLDAGLGGVHDKVPVQVTVTIPEAQLVGRPGALPGRGGSGQPLARSLLRRWWCDAQVTALLLSRGQRPLGIVHQGRTLTGAERKAAGVQFDQRCAGVGCCPGRPDPLSTLVPHHLTRYVEAGTTCLTDTVLACPTLHHDLHTGKRTVRLRDGRLINERGIVHPG